MNKWLNFFSFSGLQTLTSTTQPATTMERRPNDRVRRTLFPVSPGSSDNSINTLNEELMNQDAKILKEKYDFDPTTETSVSGAITWSPDPTGRYYMIGRRNVPDNCEEEVEKNEETVDESKVKEKRKVIDEKIDVSDDKLCGIEKCD